MTSQIPLGQAPVQKKLIEVSPGRFAEAIFFKRPEKQVICFSSQLNCAVGCEFCASPGEGKTTNLSTNEILKQIGFFLPQVTNDRPVLFSFMGEGEPLLNYRNVLEVMRWIEKNFPNGKISISTSGIDPEKIERLAREEFSIPLKLQVSIHAIDPETRSMLMPLVPSAEEIKKAIVYYETWNRGDHTRPVELNFSLIRGINDRHSDAVRICKLFRNQYIKLNKYNPIVRRPDLESSLPETIAGFIKVLKIAGLTVEYHETDGSDVNAACGQTRGMRLGSANIATSTETQE